MSTPPIYQLISKVVNFFVKKIKKKMITNSISSIIKQNKLFMLKNNTKMVVDMRDIFSMGKKMVMELFITKMVGIIKECGEIMQ